MFFLFHFLSFFTDGAVTKWDSLCSKFHTWCISYFDFCLRTLRFRYVDCKRLPVERAVRMIELTGFLCSQHRDKAISLVQWPTPRADLFKVFQRCFHFYLYYFVTLWCVRRVVCIKRPDSDISDLVIDVS